MPSRLRKRSDDLNRCTYAASVCRADDGHLVTYLRGPAQTMSRLPAVPYACALPLELDPVYSKVYKLKSSADYGRKVAWNDHGKDGEGKGPEAIRMVFGVSPRCDMAYSKD